MIGKKTLIALFALSIIGTAITMAAIFVPAVGAWFSSTFGGVGGQITGALAYPLILAVSGGGPTIFAFYGVACIIAIGFAYWVWHWDIGYKFSSATAPSSPSSGYDNTMRREPEEPERQSTVPKAM